MKLLIVDDYAEIVNILASYLELSGHEADKALNGGEAVELLRNNSYDIVITDAEMPGMNGMELCKFLKSRFPDTYIIGLSGSFSALKGLKAAGADICFSKPFDICRIEEVVKKRSSLLLDPGDRSVMNDSGGLRTQDHLCREGRCLPPPSMGPLLLLNPVQINRNNAHWDWQPATEGAAG
jgi:DNA-binding response OmpR family regulator